ncbi:MAG: hypothetical protein ACTSPB_13590 [Candidatus Thorarchaeota archaeon]
MNIQEVPKTVLKELALKYQEDRDGETFERILCRVDNLLLYVVHTLRRKWSQLQLEDIRDLYQTATIGLYNALLTVRIEETPDKVIARIIAYVKSEIRKGFPRPTISSRCGIESFSSLPVYHQLECECLREVFQSLIDQEIVSDEDFNFLRLRYVYGLPFADIARTTPLHMETVKRRVYDVTNRIRHQLRLRGIDKGD